MKPFPTTPSNGQRRSESTYTSDESGSGGGRGEAIRNSYYSDRQLPPGHYPGADSARPPREAPTIAPCPGGAARRPRVPRSSKSRDGLHVSVSSPHVSSPSGSRAVTESVHIHCAPNGSTQVSTPGEARALSSPLWRCDLIGLLGPVCLECPKLL